MEPLDLILKALDGKKRIAKNGGNYWMARDIQVILGYDKITLRVLLGGRASPAKVRDSSQNITFLIPRRVVASEVRAAIQRIGGTMPENLPKEEHIKKVITAQKN